MTALPPHLAIAQRLFDTLAEPARCECPRCKGKGETYTFEREIVCRVCNGKGTVRASDFEEPRTA